MKTLNRLVGCMEKAVAQTHSSQPAIDESTSEMCKDILGKALSIGLTSTELAFQKDVWPPTTPARHYITTFLSQFVNEVSGRVVEFAPSLYRDMFVKAEHYDVWNVEPRKGTTIVGDLQHCPHLPDGRFDAILCVHVLSALRDVWAASRELHRLLSDDGILLITVPCVLQQYAPHPKDYWRFTQDSLAAVLEPFARFEIFHFGNAATVAASPMFLRTEHFTEEVMAYHDPMSPSILAAVAWKK